MESQLSQPIQLQLSIYFSRVFVKLNDMNTLHQNLSGEHDDKCANNGSRDPIDLRTHWNWHNPLNILPLGIVAMVVLGITLMVLK